MIIVKVILSVFLAVLAILFGISAMNDMAHSRRQHYLCSGDKCRLSINGVEREFEFVGYHDESGYILLKDEDGKGWKMSEKDFQACFVEE